MYPQRPVQMKPSVPTALALIPLLVLYVLTSTSKMKFLQNNIQSINTSMELLRHALGKYNPDLVLLQEVWSPKDKLFFKGCNPKPVMKTRSNRIGLVLQFLWKVTFVTKGYWSTKDRIWRFYGQRYMSKGNECLLDLFISRHMTWMAPKYWSRSWQPFAKNSITSWLVWMPILVIQCGISPL